MPSALIIGAGPNVGQATAESFANAGYTVGVASRSQKLDSKFAHFLFDASKPETVAGLFSEVSAAIGVPSVVVYNVYSPGMTNKNNPFETPLDKFQSDLNINTVSPWVSAGEAIKGFEKLGAEGLGPEGATFIFTGNMLNTKVFPAFMAFGMGKSASSHMIEHLALVAYTDKPYKFYFGDERHDDGSPMTTDLNGSNHGEVYFDLAKAPEQRAWHQTFVQGKGYVEFPTR